MALIASRRHRPDDLAHWTVLARTDALRARLAKMNALEARALAALEDFVRRGPCYIGVSWGKESMVVAHMAARLRLGVPVVWFPAGTIENPDCVLVRDEFLARFDVRYIEHEAASIAWSQDGTHRVHDGAQEAFVRATKAYGARYVSGVRAEESRARRLRMKHWGESSINTCAPIGWWKIEDVYAYMARYDLPVHPAYACTMGGQYPRESIRVATIGGILGGNRGRREWEAMYYPEMTSHPNTT